MPLGQHGESAGAGRGRGLAYSVGAESLHIITQAVGLIDKARKGEELAAKAANRRQGSRQADDCRGLAAQAANKASEASRLCVTSRNTALLGFGHC